METQRLDFERGPIRPPNEARSLLIRVTRNCPWNRCLFCPVYKGTTFSRRSLTELKADVDTIASILTDLKDLSWRLGCGGNITDPVISAVFGGNYSQGYQNVAAWLYFGTGAVFLQDANNLILKTVDLAEFLKYLREKVPGITRITTYARSSTTARKTVEELVTLREAGLDRVHLGLETGYDPLLEFMEKGVTAKAQVEAGQKIKAAGISLSEYVMPGLGGRKWWREHAIHTAQVLNQIDPDFIRLRSLRVPSRIPLYQKLREGEFEMLTDDETIEEIRLFIQNLDGIHSTLTSDHIMNLLEEVGGTFPQDKAKMLAIIDQYRGLPERDKLIYRLGRRGGAYRSVEELKDETRYRKISRALDQVLAETPGGIEQVMAELADQYV
jgi:hypothetical protein